MHRNSSSVQQAQHFSPFIARENPYKEWGMWGGIFTALSVAATIAFSAFGIAFGWPLAIAVLGALFTAVAVAATYSHEKTSERNEELAQRKEHEKELAKQMQIEQDKTVAKQMQMKEEEAKMEKYEKTYTKFTTAAQYTDANNHAVQQPTQQELQKQLQSLVREGWIEGANDVEMWAIINSNIRSIAEFRFKEGGEINAVRINHNTNGQECTNIIVVNPINPAAPKEIRKKIEDKHNRGR